MKDSVRAAPDNLSDQRRPRCMAKGLFNLFLFFLATWKDILHSAHISWTLCILQLSLRASSEYSEKNINAAMGPCRHVHTPTACVWKYTVHELYYCFFSLSLFFIISLFVHRCSAAPWVKLVMRRTVLSAKQEVPRVKQENRKRNDDDDKGTFVPLEQSKVQLETRQNTVPEIRLSHRSMLCEWDER